MLLSRSTILCIAVLSACAQDEEVKPPSKTGTYTGTVSVMGYLGFGLRYLGEAEVNVAQDGPYVIAVASVEFGGSRLVAGVFEGTIDATGRFYSHKDLVDLAARGRTAAHEETLDGVNMSGDGARSPTGGAVIP